MCGFTCFSFPKEAFEALLKIDDFMSKQLISATISFCRSAGHVICGSNAKANTRVTVRAKGPTQQLTCCVSCVRPRNGQVTIVSDNPLVCLIGRSGLADQEEAWQAAAC